MKTLKLYKCRNVFHMLMFASAAERENFYTVMNSSSPSRSDMEVKCSSHKLFPQENVYKWTRKKSEFRIKLFFITSSVTQHSTTVPYANLFLCWSKLAQNTWPRCNVQKWALLNVPTRSSCTLVSHFQKTKQIWACRLQENIIHQNHQHTLDYTYGLNLQVVEELFLLTGVLTSV